VEFDGVDDSVRLLVNSSKVNIETKYLNISFQLLFKAGVQALPALQAELALQKPENFSSITY